MGVALQFAAGHGVRRGGGSRGGEQDRLPGGTLGQWVSRPDPIGNVEVGPGGLDDRERECLVAIGNAQVSGRPDRLGQGTQYGHRDIAKNRLDSAGKVQHPESDEEPATRIAADQGMLLKGAHQAIGHRPVDVEACGQLGHGQALRALREHPQDP